VTDTLTPFPASNDDEARAVSGDVIVPAEELAAHEKIIRANWKAATTKLTAVYDALAIIHTKGLWKLHVEQATGKPFKSFEKYLFGVFGWELSRVRALQISKERRPALLESGALTEADMPKERTRQAPTITATRAANVSQKQLEKVQAAVQERALNIEPGPGADAFADFAAELDASFKELFSMLQGVVDTDEQAAADAAAEAAAE
jgi:hypothetical protein